MKFETQNAAQALIRNERMPWIVRNMIAASSRRLWLAGLCAMSAAGVLLMLLVANATEAAYQQRQAQMVYVHTLNVLLVTGELKSAVHAAMRGQRGYVLTTDPHFLEPYEASRAATAALIRQLRMLTADNASQQSNLAVLDTYLTSYLGVLENMVALTKSGRQQEAIEIVRSRLGERQVDLTLQAIGRVEAEERHLARLHEIANERAAQQTERYGYALAGTGGLLLLTTTLAGTLALRAYRRSLDAYEEMRRLATTDALTGLMNRGHFMAHLNLAVADAERSGVPVSLAMLDIDRFKRINDVHGHPAGDEVLRAVADLLSRTTRAGDLVGRLGGEEFAVLMPNTSCEQARIVSERLREAIATKSILLPSGIITYATVSTGVALLAGGETVTRLVARADAALYEAKHGGRNQVKLAA